MAPWPENGERIGRSLPSLQLWANPTTCVTEPNSPLLAALYKKPLPFSLSLLPTTHKVELVYTEEKNTTEETGNELWCHRGGKFTFLFIS